MNHNEKPFAGYDTGADFWRDNVLNYGIDEAVVISSRYLEMNMKCECSDDEKQFCREIFMEMYEATASKVDPAKLVYPYPFEEANRRMESSYFQINRSMNQECARAMDAAISASHYKTNHYNLKLATMFVISKCGLERVNAVLAFQIQRHESDGRYSGANKKWARNFILPDNAFGFMVSHATLIEDFATYARKLYEELGAERFALPGNQEQGEDVHGYTVIRKYMIDENNGYVIAHNPCAVSPYVCWKYHTQDGESRFDWGLYGEEQDVVDGYIARLFVAFN